LASFDRCQPTFMSELMSAGTKKTFDTAPRPRRFPRKPKKAGKREMPVAPCLPDSMRQKYKKHSELPRLRQVMRRPEGLVTACW